MQAQHDTKKSMLWCRCSTSFTVVCLMYAAHVTLKGGKLWGKHIPHCVETVDVHTMPTSECCAVSAHTYVCTKPAPPTEGVQENHEQVVHLSCSF
uniref:Uncharacterized protein n=1 Tax=Rhipicephalus zambeziensis TaxID=60191 RepID=A0A224Y676_9ACAR